MNIHRGNAMPVVKLPMVALAFLVVALAILLVGIFTFLAYCLTGIFVAFIAPLVAIGFIEGDITDFFRRPGRILTRAGGVIEKIWAAWKNAIL
jgi:hypothetical protein